MKSKQANLLGTNSVKAQKEKSKQLNAVAKGERTMRSPS